MGPATALITSFRRSFDFSGRASRSEFWWTWVILYTVAQVILMVRGLATREQNTTSVATVILFALALPMMAVGTRRLADAGVWRWWFVAVFLFGIFAQIIYRIPLPHETSVGHIKLQFDDGVKTFSEMGYYPVLQWLRDAMPWLGYPAAILCLLFALLPSRVPQRDPETSSGKVLS